MIDKKTKIIDTYKTIAKPNRAEIKVKGSKFIASVAHVPDKDSALQFLNTIRSEFFDATHNCFAYRIGHDGMEFRAADDGEPNGSAGKPILFTINKFELSDVIVVVTRYYGGTKLGIGGLARAYSQAAELALSECETKIIHRTITVRIMCMYEDVTPIKKLIDDKAVSFEEYYSDAVEYLVQIHLSEVEEFRDRIVSMTNARAGVFVLPEVR